MRKRSSNTRKPYKKLLVLDEIQNRKTSGNSVLGTSIRVVFWHYQKKTRCTTRTGLSITTKNNLIDFSSAITAGRSKISSMMDKYKKKPVLDNPLFLNKVVQDLLDIGPISGEPIG